MEQSETDDILSSVYDAEAIAARKAAGMAAYEERIVKKLLVHLGLAGSAAELAKRAKEKTGKARLSFEWFYEEYPDFPIYLVMRRIPFAFKVGVKDLFNKFCSTPMFKAWEEFRDEAPVEDKPIGLVFDWPGVAGTQMIMHNGANGYFDFDNRVRIVRSIGRGRNVEPITVEQFIPFLDELLKTWKL
jgi:hypothetical protein